MKHWTAEDIETVKRLFAEHAPNEAYIAAVGRTRHACWQKIDRLRQAPQLRARQKPFRKPPVEVSDRVPETALQDAKRRLTAPRSVTAWICGDPAPGQSALERRA